MCFKTFLLVGCFFLSVPATPSIFPASLPHVEEMAPGIYASGFGDRYGSTNCGWVALGDCTLLIDLPHGVEVLDFLSQVVKLTGKPVQRLILTHLEDGDFKTLRSLAKHGIVKIQVSSAMQERLGKALVDVPSGVLQGFSQRTLIDDKERPGEFIPYASVTGKPGAAVYFSLQQVLFTGPIGVNGPRVHLPGSSTASWITVLGELQKLAATKIVPGFGSWGGPELLNRQQRFLIELRRQVAHLIAQERTLNVIRKAVSLSADYLVWMPYDTPSNEDIDHVYGELTIPLAPFNEDPPRSSDPRTHALVLIGDRPHEPRHIEEGLRPVFQATQVVPHFTVDVRALSAENLNQVRLLVILRDGMQWPDGQDKPGRVWMTPEQERAVVDFVERGGAFLNLHNSMGLYPAGGPYLNLVGGRYIGHGPLERFRVEVVDPNHPITRGVQDFTVADEQHTPPYDMTKAHLLLQNRSDDGNIAAAGWAYEPGRGRLCHLANGHTREALLHPMVQRLMRNAVNWCLRREETRLEDKP